MVFDKISQMTLENKRPESKMSHLIRHLPTGPNTIDSFRRLMVGATVSTLELESGRAPVGGLIAFAASMFIDVKNEVFPKKK
ncbi:MAG: hypothetical protein US39_C0017G0004 [Microgenomates group bacterium GW2011_GWC1_37_12b]|uniref:Uncharacterized protein n=1 Tax=Candidatus Woesebacteria bacterium GW2011_GWB1_38_8b TaxID=1618571 RepID=A0A0G0PB65_9BACT|nr:MAG: hypothetical protein US39_C0017G0004 [Microgenomates group bacterium GW2011_GWC1_37_12b]KKQ86541.1 MAG: hypothetical protein UT10_C0022G0002 [Candidatus Woesebacteria bacterium GW2011_GWB1_38_8b]